MKVLDANVLLYAVNSDSPHHAAAKSWLERTLSGTETAAFPWIVTLAFLRLSTSARVFPRPLEPNDALAVIDGWLSRPVVVALDPGPEHWRILKSLLEEAGTAGNLSTDAHLAAIALERGAELCSTDADFARFPRLRWMNLLAEWGAH